MLGNECLCFGACVDGVDAVLLGRDDLHALAVGEACGVAPHAADAMEFLGVRNYE